MSAGVARQVFYGVAALVGLVLTWYFNLTYQGSASYLEAWFANSASSSAAVDLIVVSVVASVFIVAESRRLGLRWPVLYLVVGFAGAMAFAVPLFLLVRERRLQRDQAARRAERHSRGRSTVTSATIHPSGGSSPQP